MIVWLKFIKNGTILREAGAKPKPHELITAKALIVLDDAIFLKEIKISEANTPDIIWLGYKWEIKAPKGRGKWTIQNDISNTLKQSDNIIVDLFRYPLPEIVTIHKLKREALNRKKIKRLCYITKRREIIILK